jgi:hypothetical protein
MKDGELLDVLNHNPLVSHIPVLAFSWQSEGAGKLSECVAAYLQEPVTYDAFLDALHKAGVTC